jgi:hypothetical protein
MRSSSASWVLAALAFTFGLGAGTASAASCPPGTTLDCKGSNPMRPPMCRCIATGGSWSGPASQGKAEIKRKNVPQVQPSKKPPD